MTKEELIDFRAELVRTKSNYMAAMAIKSPYVRMPVGACTPQHPRDTKRRPTTGAQYSAVFDRSIAHVDELIAAYTDTTTTEKGK